jgi:hypothetical protein
MGRFQNNPSIGWVHQKFTHACPLAWGNNNIRKKNNVKVGFEQELSTCFFEYFECIINYNTPLRNMFIVKGFQNNVPNSCILFMGDHEPR